MPRKSRSSKHVYIGDKAVNGTYTILILSSSYGNQEVFGAAENIHCLFPVEQQLLAGSWKLSDAGHEQRLPLIFRNINRLLIFYNIAFLNTCLLNIGPFNYLDTLYALCFSVRITGFRASYDRLVSGQAQVGLGHA